MVYSLDSEADETSLRKVAGFRASEGVANKPHAPNP